MQSIKQTRFNVMPDYLHNRKQYTEINGEKSKTEHVTMGIPQGGVLAALLFVIYTNDIGYLKLNGKIIMYADDVVIFYEEFNSHKIQEDLNKIHNYYRINMLSLNTMKTKYMIHKSLQNQINMDDISVTMNENQIQRVRVMKYLGLNIDECLTWTPHIHQLAK